MNREFKNGSTDGSTGCASCTGEDSRSPATGVRNRSNSSASTATTPPAASASSPAALSAPLPQSVHANILPTTSRYLAVIFIIDDWRSRLSRSVELLPHNRPQPPTGYGSTCSLRCVIDCGIGGARRPLVAPTGSSTLTRRVTLPRSQTCAQPALDSCSPTGPRRITTSAGFGKPIANRRRYEPTTSSRRRLARPAAITGPNNVSTKNDKPTSCRLSTGLFHHRLHRHQQASP